MELVYIILKYLTVSGCAGLCCVAALAVLPSPPPPPAQLFVRWPARAGPRITSSSTLDSVPSEPNKSYQTIRRETRANMNSCLFMSNMIPCHEDYYLLLYAPVQHCRTDADDALCCQPPVAGRAGGGQGRARGRTPAPALARDSLQRSSDKP